MALRCFSQNVPPCVWNQPKLTGTYRQGNSSSDLDPFSLKSTLLHFGASANNTVSNMFDSVAIPWNYLNNKSYYPAGPGVTPSPLAPASLIWCYVQLLVALCGLLCHPPQGCECVLLINCCHLSGVSYRVFGHSLQL